MCASLPGALPRTGVCAGLPSATENSLLPKQHRSTAEPLRHDKGSVWLEEARHPVLRPVRVGHGDFRTADDRHWDWDRSPAEGNAQAQGRKAEGREHQQRPDSTAGRPDGQRSGSGRKQPVLIVRADFISPPADACICNARRAGFFTSFASPPFHLFASALVLEGGHTPTG
jgi:hypothetical protein